MLAEVLKGFADPLGILDSFLCLTAVGVLLGMVRQLTGNIAACIGLHAGWVAVIYVVRETSVRKPASPAAWLMSDYDGFIGWMVLAWTPVIGWRCTGGTRTEKRGRPTKARHAVCRKIRTVPFCSNRRASRAARD